MTRDDTERARAKLETLKHVFLAFAIVYLALHFWVGFAAWRQAGAVAAIATILTLGFGDLYWAWSWGSSESPGSFARESAIVAAAMAFLSWGARPWTTRYIYRLGAQSISIPVRDYADEPDDAGEAGEDQWEVAADDVVAVDDDVGPDPIDERDPSPPADDATPAGTKANLPRGGGS